MQTKRKPLLPGTGVPQMERQIVSSFGTSDDGRVAIVFSQPVNNQLLTVEKAEEWIRNIQQCIDTVKSGKIPENAVRVPANGTKQ